MRRLVVLCLVPLAVVTLPGVAYAVLGSPALLKIKSGDATFCLEAQAGQVLEAGGIGMSAGAPAQLLTTGPQPCVTTHVTDGAVSLGLTGGAFPFNGAITFTRSADQAKITFSDIKVTFAVPSTVSAVVDGNTADPITVLSFIPMPGNIMTDGRYLIAHDVPLNLTAAGARALASAFGDSPVASGAPLFMGTGQGQLEAGLLPTLPVLG
jgi:hypothetical protein